MGRLNLFPVLQRNLQFTSRIAPIPMYGNPNVLLAIEVPEEVVENRSGSGNRKSPECVHPRAQLWEIRSAEQPQSFKKSRLADAVLPAINVMRPRRSNEIALRLRKFFTVSSVSMAQLLAAITRGYVTGVGRHPFGSGVSSKWFTDLTDRICLRQGEVRSLGTLGMAGVSKRRARRCACRSFMPCGAGPLPGGVLDDGARLPPVSRIVPPFSHRLTTTTSACNRSSRGRPGVYLACGNAWPR